MTEDACWKQFMTTGKVEDYLQFKAKSEATDRMENTNGEGAHAGFSKGDRTDTGRYSHRGI